MKKKVFLLAVLWAVLAIPQSAKAYDFSAVAPSGQTLYYYIMYDIAVVVPENRSTPYYSTYPTGALTIPSSVTNNGQTYSVTGIGDNAFYGCSGLTSVTIPNSVTSIGQAAFSYCSGLPSVTIPNSVTSINDRAFSGCSGLTTVNFNAIRCTTMGSVACPVFSGCSNLTAIYIGNSVTQIPYCAFYGCSGLTSVTIPNSVTSIGGSAFANCSGLTEIHSQANVAPTLVAPTLGGSAFDGVPSTIPVYIPCGRQMSYYSRWSYFSNFVEAAAYTFSAQSADSTMGTVTVLTQPTCTAPTAVVNATAHSGYRFLRWNDGNTTNPRSLTLTQDTSITACFVRPPSDTTSGRDTTYIYIHDTTRVTDTVTITNTLHDTTYITLTDTVTNTIHDTTFVTIPLDTVFMTDTLRLVARDTVYLPVYIQGTHDTIYLPIYIHDTTAVAGTHDTVYLPVYYYDTAYITRTDTLTNTVYDTTYIRVPYPVHDTSYITLTDTVTNTVYDTTYVRVPYPVHDTSYITLTDTVTNTVYDTIVLDTLTLTQYVPVHDTTYIRVPVHDTTIVTIPLDTIFVTDTVTLTQTVYVPLFDTTYIPVHDTTYIPVQVHDTTVVTNTVYDTAYVDRYIHDTTYVSVTVHDTTVVTQFDTVNITLYDTVYVGAPTYHRLSVRSGNDLMGVGAGSGYFPVNTTVEIAAVPQYGFAFLRWLDGNTENPRTVVVEDADATYTALFAVTNTPEGIDGNDDAWGYDVSTSRDIITVRGAEGHNIKVYDMSGRVLASQRDAAEVQSFRVPATGTYLVQVDGLPAKKVVVIK